MRAFIVSLMVLLRIIPKPKTIHQIGVAKQLQEDLEGRN
jgi:hypothetical protein